MAQHTDAQAVEREIEQAHAAWMSAAVRGDHEACEQCVADELTMVVRRQTAPISPVPPHGVSEIEQEPGSRLSLDFGESSGLGSPKRLVKAFPRAEGSSWVPTAALSSLLRPLAVG